MYPRISERKNEVAR